MLARTVWTAKKPWQMCWRGPCGHLKSIEKVLARTVRTAKKLWKICWRGPCRQLKTCKLWSALKYLKIAPILTIQYVFWSHWPDLSFETHFVFCCFFVVFVFLWWGARRSRGEVEVRLRRGRGEVEARSRRGRGEVETRSRRMYVKCNVSLRTLHSQNVTFH